MTPHDEMQTHIEGVRNWLGVPRVKDLFSTPSENLSDTERINRMLYVLYRDNQEMRVHGCAVGAAISGRLNKMEKWYYKFVGASLAMGIVVGAVYFLIAVLGFVKKMVTE